MGLPLTNISDYKSGEYSLPLNSLTQKDILEDIDTWEEKYLCDLLGYDLYNLFLADLDVDNAPQSPRFINIFNKLHVYLDCYEQKFLSFGIIEMLKGFVCFEYLNSIEYQQTMVGTKSNESANSKDEALLKGRTLKLYNTSIAYYQAIQVYICQNLEEYPEFKGEEKLNIAVL